MPLVKYKDISFRGSTLAIIEQANEIIAEYVADGYDLTLRQLYYQFVARDIIPNKQSEYSRLGSIINDARLAGLIDWGHITDRTRNVRSNSHWNDPASIMRSAAASYKIDKWERQPVRIEVWIEKDALAGVFDRVCRELDVPLFSCRGYTSQSEMWAAAQRMQKHADFGQEPVILHFGDHDPSGIDMTRDIADRLELFMGGTEVNRLALNMEQVEEFNPPPNPAKTTDSRFKAYIVEYGAESWELDALDPRTLSTLVEDTVARFRDDDLWDEAVAEEQEAIDLLNKAARNWHTIADDLRGK